MAVVLAYAMQRPAGCIRWSRRSWRWRSAASGVWVRCGVDDVELLRSHGLQRSRGGGKIALPHVNEFPDYYTRPARRMAGRARGADQMTS